MSLNNQIALFITMIQKISAITITIDALDECKDTKGFIHYGLEQIIRERC